MIARHYAGGRSYLSKSIAAYMSAYWIDQGKPLPDCVVPLSLPWYEKRRLSGNPHSALAENCSFFFACPCVPILKHRIFKTEQTGGRCHFSYRPTTSSYSYHEWFKWVKKNRQSVEDQNVLLIALDQGDLTALIEAAECLQEEYPKSVSALTFI
ncbi:hypothetical protein ELAC_0368 [Estrella lausannensis]|uniref:Uncharacterized protein n=2 Tax=Estrella lausannensis TaxID=483423 RepID=A0A0H5DQB0_9BACT|nr:hypothetical protein ELAC_0368 [Estrella lausannensis]